MAQVDESGWIAEADSKATCPLKACPTRRLRGRLGDGWETGRPATRGWSISPGGDKERHIATHKLGIIVRIDRVTATRKSSSIHAAMSGCPFMWTANRRASSLSSNLAYVAASRARHDAQIYTNGAGNLGHALSREVSPAAPFECNEAEHGMGLNQGTTEEKRNTTATITPRAADTPWRWSSQGVLTKETFDVSGAMDDPENLNAVGERPVEDEIALEAFYGPGADGREARIPKAPLRAQFRHLR